MESGTVHGRGIDLLCWSGVTLFPGQTGLPQACERLVCWPRHPGNNVVGGRPYISAFPTKLQLGTAVLKSHLVSISFHSLKWTDLYGNRYGYFALVTLLHNQDKKGSRHWKLSDPEQVRSCGGSVYRGGSKARTISKSNSGSMQLKCESSRYVTRHEGEMGYWDSCVMFFSPLI